MKTLNVALQGGGSHGAFSWGVLDALLADDRIVLEGLSGTSAGALNAVALASGHAQAVAQRRDPRAGAREALARLWDEVARWGAVGSIQADVARMFWGGLRPELAPANLWANAFRGVFSPAQSNPLDINPLRDLLVRDIDFTAIARPGGPKVFVSATHVNTGKAVIFSGAQLTADAVMASACLPTLFRPVVIDGEAYWDGGYSVNPALTPLIDACDSTDLLVVQINPLKRDHAPRSGSEIADRINELTFNASLLSQMRSIDFINRLLRDGHLSHARCKEVLLHRIDGGLALQPYGAASKTRADPGMIREMFDLGQAAARQWLQTHYSALGQHGTVDVRTDYLDDTRLTLPPASPAHDATRRPGFRAWVARLFRRKRSAP